MLTLYYLYCNSKASSYNGKLGFLKEVRKKKGYVLTSVVTTTEFAFAKEFKSLESVNEYINKHNLWCIIFERKDLS